jgi:hypothetical protein
MIAGRVNELPDTMASEWTEFGWWLKSRVSLADAARCSPTQLGHHYQLVTSPPHLFDCGLAVDWVAASSGAGRDIWECSQRLLSLRGLQRA